MMRRDVPLLQRIDWIAIGLIAALALLGWINVISATAGAEEVHVFDLATSHGKQLLFIGICALLAVAILNVEGEFFIRTALINYGINLLLLVLVLAVGKKVGGARAWFGFGSFSMQPAEFAKSATALSLAWLLSRSEGRFRGWAAALQSSVLVLIPAALILLQPDLGTVLVFFGLVFALYREGLSGNVLVVGFSAIVLGVATILTGASSVNYPFFGPASGIYILVALLGIGGVVGVALAARNAVPRTRTRLRRIGYPTVLAAALFCGGLHASFEEILQPHQRERIYVLFGLDAGDPDADYNIRHAKAAIGSGGFIGKGFMQGPMTAYGFVPEQSTDFIFCTVGEEWGFLGSAFVVLLFGALLLRILVIAERQRSDFTRIYAYAVASILFMHVLINVGMVLGLAPVIGIPLPFFSYGGSSLLGTTVLVFILLRLDAERFLVLR